MGHREWGCYFRNDTQGRPMIKMAFLQRHKGDEGGKVKDSIHHSTARRIYCLPSLSAPQDASAPNSSLSQGNHVSGKRQKIKLLE